MATGVVLATLLLLAMRATPQMATTEPRAAELPLTVSEALESVTLDTEGVTPEGRMTTVTDLSESLQPQLLGAVGELASGSSDVMTSHNESFVTTTSTSDLVNGKGRPVELSAVCQRWSETEIDLVCALRGSEVTVRGQAGSSVQLSCQSGTELTCEDLPQMTFGMERSIRLSLQYCSLPPHLGCFGPRLNATIKDLYLYNPPGDISLTADMMQGLDELESFVVYGDGVEKYSMDFPSKIFSTWPSLRSLTINNIKLSLQPHDLDGVSGLQYLELSKVGLASLPPAIFARLNKLQKLYIWKNQIKELNEEVFQSLSSLEQLDVSSNELSSLEAIAAGLPSLTVLAIRGNPIQLLSPLARTKHLQKLDLFGNTIPLTVAAGALASLPNLTNVNLQGNFLTHLPEDMFHGSSALKTLKLCNNNITDLPANLFRDLQALEELDLSQNKLTTLRPQGFQALSSLKKLNLNHNQIARLTANALFGACALTWLSVSRNEVHELAAGSMTCGGHNRLEFIDLSYNKLVRFSPLSHTQYSDLSAAFTAYSDSLQSLDLSHNRLTAPPYDVHGFINLRRLDLSHNNLTELLPQDLTFLSAHAEVDYRYNSIALVRVAAGTPPGARPTVQGWSDESRSTVRLDHNPFECDCKLYYFATRLHGYVAYDTTESRLDVGGAACASPASLTGRPLPSVPLQDFACTSSEVPELPCAAGCFCVYRPHSNAIQLTCPSVPHKPDTSDLRDVHLELRLTQPKFANFTFDVRVLNLSGLALTTVPETLPQGLRLLDLSNNQLTGISRDLLQSDIKLRLAGNALQCDCSHKSALRLLKEYWYNIEDGSAMNCANGLPFTDISVDALCSTRTAVLIGVPLALIGLLTVILAIILMRYSLEIRVWLHAKGLFTHWQAIDDEHRTYDAFVSFCHKDETFVTQQLVPGLEKDTGGWRPYKLCIHYRDWIPGEWIPAQIARSVADSRRTIIVVSKNFLDSLWGRAEFRTANMSAIKERQTRVIVVLLEDISSHKELDPELKAYLSTNTYLKWGDPWFWEKLRYALPHRRQPAQVTAGAKLKKGSAKESTAAEKGLKGVTGLPEVLSPAGLLVPAAVPVPVPVPLAFSNKCERFDIEIGNLKGMDIADLKEIKTVT